MPNQNLLTIQQFAVYWTISERSVYRLLKKGLPSVQIGGLRRILKSQADAFLYAGGFKRKPKTQRKPRKTSSEQPSPSTSAKTDQ